MEFDSNKIRLSPAQELFPELVVALQNWIHLTLSCGIELELDFHFSVA